MHTKRIPYQASERIAVIHIDTPGIDTAAAQVIATSMQDMRPIVVLDFAQVAFINSEGFSTLLDSIASARRAGYQLFAVNVSPHHQKIFKAFEMSRFMPIVEEHDLDAYLAEL